MKVFLATTCIVTGTLLAGGCATKKYVRNTTAPIQAKVDQVGEQTTRNGERIEDTRNQVKQVDDKAQAGISAATERASAADQHAAAADQHAATADQHAGDAMNKANQVGEQAQQAFTQLRGTIAGLDDYKLQTSVAVPFQFDKSILSDDAKAELDKFAGEVKNDKRFFIAVEGYTDKTGSRAYNEALSQRRADSVVRYLVGKHDLPLNRIYKIGLADDKPADDGKGRDARAKNRRVEVKVFTADQQGAASANDSARVSSR
jgi:outer membrane protein OmpA-like peptidoglycan-associated protein